ncbi:MAG: hypothetical protein EHM83_13955, partial [Burkholderiales bacterium]
MALSCLTARALAGGGLPMGPALLAGTAAAALAGLALIAASVWRDAGAEDAAEAAAFRLQGIYASALVLLYAAGSALL